MDAVPDGSGTRRRFQVHLDRVGRVHERDAPRLDNDDLDNDDIAEEINFDEYGSHFEDVSEGDDEL